MTHAYRECRRSRLFLKSQYLHLWFLLFILCVWVLPVYCNMCANSLWLSMHKWVIFRYKTFRIHALNAMWCIMDNCLTFPQVMIVFLVTLMDCWFKRGACGPICAGHFASNILESKPYFLFYFFMHDPAYFGIWHYMALIFFSCMVITSLVYMLNVFILGAQSSTFFPRCRYLYFLFKLEEKSYNIFKSDICDQWFLGCRSKVILPDTLNCKDFL